MSGLFLANPWGLTALAALAAVVAAYFFYRRYAPRTVAGLFLWGLPEKTARGGRHFERPRWRRSFWLDMAAAALLALAVAAPCWRTRSAAPLVAVLDDSFALQSRNNHLVARSQVLAWLEEARRADRLTAVILAGELPRILTPLREAPGDAAALLADWLPTEPSADLAEALRLAGSLYAAPLDIRVVTNRDIPLATQPENRLTVRRLAGRGGNVAFTGMWRETSAPADGDGSTGPITRFHLAVANYADEIAYAVITLHPHDGPADPAAVARWAEQQASSASTETSASADEESGHAETLLLTPGGRKTVSIAVPGTDDRLWVARIKVLNGADVTPMDSLALLPPEPPRTVTYAMRGMAGDGARYFRLALDAAGATPWIAPAPALADTPNEASAPDLLILSGEDAAADGDAGLTVAVPVQAGPATYVSPFVVDLSDPLCRDVHLESMYWTAAVATPEAATIMGAPLVSTGTVPLLWRESPTRLHLNLVPERSDLVTRPDWPALVANLVAAARDLRPGLRKTLYTSGELLDWQPWPVARPIPGRLPASAPPAQSVAATGTGTVGDRNETPTPPPTTPTPPRRRASPRTDLTIHDGDRVVERVWAHGSVRVPRRPGVYELRRDGRPGQRFAVAAVYPEASDTRTLSAQNRTEAPDMADGVFRPGIVELRWLPLVLAFLLMACNWRKGDE